MTSAVPPPTGPFGVGRTSREWADPARPDPYAPDPSEPRRLVTWIWYPRDPGPGEPAEYLPSGWEAAGEMLGLRTAGLTANSVDGAAVSVARAAAGRPSTGPGVPRTRCGSPAPLT